MHASVNWVSIGLDNDLSPAQRQAITWTSDDFLLFGLSGTYFINNLTEIHMFSYMKIDLKM